MHGRYSTNTRRIYRPICRPRCRPLRRWTPPIRHKWPLGPSYGIPGSAPASPVSIVSLVSYFFPGVFLIPQTFSSQVLKWVTSHPSSLISFFLRTSPSFTGIAALSPPQNATKLSPGRFSVIPLRYHRLRYDSSLVVSCCCCHCGLLLPLL